MLAMAIDLFGFGFIQIVKNKLRNNPKRSMDNIDNGTACQYCPGK